MNKFWLLFLCWNLAYGQTQIYFPKVSGKEHERAIITLPKQLILSGSSNATIRLHDGNGKVIKMQKLGEDYKEIRDLCQTQTGYIAMQSHDSSGIVLLKHNLETDTVIYPFKQRSALFLDGISSEDNKVFLFGDPIDGLFSTFRSFDNGHTWEPTPGQVKAIDGQAAFAASGQTCQLVGSKIYFVSGGLKSALHYSPDFGLTWKEQSLPFPSCPSCGPYALTIVDSLNFIVVGGDYKQPNHSKNTCFFSQDGGYTWQAPKKAPSGYRSCIISIGDLLYCCGTNGIDRSSNGGKTWKKIYSVNALSLTFNGIYIYASLADGSILRFKP